MKKLLLILIAISLVTFVHGQETQKPNNFDFGGVCLIAMSDNEVVPGPGIAASWNNSNLFGTFGLGTNLHIVMPVVEDITGNAFAISLLTGVNYMIFDNGTFAVPVTFGFHFSSTSVTVGETQLVTINMGAGTAFDFLWRFGEKWYGYGRMMLAFNFGDGGEFLMFPGIGAGFSF